MPDKYKREMMRRFTGDPEGWFGGSATWRPNIEAFQRGNEFVVRADLPGIEKDDVTVEIADEALTIHGERREEREEEREGFYRSERSYGTFYRSVPLPQGALADTAQANFKNGVLEVTVEAPPTSVSRGRKLEIGEGRASEATKKNLRPQSVSSWQDDKETSGSER